MSSAHGSPPGTPGVSAPIAVVMASVLFFALAIAGLGGLSYFTDTDIIAVPGLGQAPGAVGMAAALIAFAATLWPTVRPQRPSYTPVLITTIAVPLTHLVVVWIAVLFTGAGLVVATTVAGDFVRNGVSLVLLIVAAASAWSGVALRRTRAQRPEWPWERDDDSEH